SRLRVTFLSSTTCSVALAGLVRGTDAPLVPGFSSPTLVQVPSGLSQTALPSGRVARTRCDCASAAVVRVSDSSRRRQEKRRTGPPAIGGGSGVSGTRLVPDCH